MSKKVLAPKSLAKPLGPYSLGIEAEGKKFIFVSGTVPEDENKNVVGIGDIEAQVRKTLDNVKAVLAESGAELKDVVKMSVFITDARDFEVVQKVRAEYFKPPYPASTLVVVKDLYRKEVEVEIEAIAVIG